MSESSPNKKPAQRLQRNRRLLILLGILVSYILVACALLPHVGPTAFILYVIVPTMAGYLTGLKGGLLFGFLGIPINLLFVLVGMSSWEPSGFTMGHGACMIVGGMVGAIQDLREQLKQQLSRNESMMSQIRESEERFRNLFELAPDGIAITDMKGVITDVNAAALKQSGYSADEIVGKRFGETGVLQERDIPRLLEKVNSIMTGTASEPIEIEINHRDGTRSWVDVSCSWLRVNDEKVGVQIITRDITIRRQIEKKLREAERLATIGQVAGMVGHDLRNPLQAITTAIYLLKQSTKEVDSKLSEYKRIPDSLPKSIGDQFNSDIKKEIEERDETILTIEEAVKYANKIVSDLQDYARPIELKLEETDLHGVINGTLSTIDVPETISISVLIPEGLPKPMVDPGLMRRVFTNLIMNGIQAMPSGGKLIIKASKAEEAILTSVEDTGMGISKENMQRLFYPLFTTKAKGTGLGLPICKRVIEAHGGNITAESEEGKGSIFTVKIPLMKKEVD